MQYFVSAMLFWWHIAFVECTLNLIIKVDLISLQYSRTRIRIILNYIMVLQTYELN